MPMLGSQQPCGSYTGNGTSQSISIGRRPIKVRIINWSKDGAEEVLKLEGMENDTAQISKSIKGKILSGAITLTDNGFMVGSSKYVNENGSTYLWEAW